MITEAGAGGVSGVPRRPRQELALELIYTDVVTLEEARLVLSFFAEHYPLSVCEQVGQLMPSRRVTPDTPCAPFPLATAV